MNLLVSEPPRAARPILSLFPLFIALVFGIAEARAAAPESQPPADRARISRLVLIGDSTVRNGRGDGAGALWGWGDLLAQQVDTNVVPILNRALGGRSSRTFRTEGLWEKVQAELRPGDLVVMQFGHNDGGELAKGDRPRASLKGSGDDTRDVVVEKTGRAETVHTYGWYLRQYATEARAKGARVVVLSPIPRNLWKDGRVARATNDYGRWAAEAARAAGAAFIDLNQLVAQSYEQEGRDHVAANYFTAADHTHTTQAGARLNASTIAQALRALPLALPAPPASPSTVNGTGTGTRTGTPQPPAAPASIPLTVQTRDPETGAPRLATETVDPRRVAVVAVDVWNWHWCKTATMRVDAFVPRLNLALNAARDLGMTVLLCPSDVVDNYVGRPQREKVLALALEPVPTVQNVSCPPVPDAGGCACGRERCAGNYGWDGMHPDLQIGDADLMPDSQAEVYTICRQRGITHLIYVGFHTQVCLLGKPMGLKAMKSAGLRCVLARDMTDAHPGYDPARGFTPDLNTAQVIEHFERHLAPTIHFEEELTRLHRWHPDGPVDPVRITPWGTQRRPHLFEQPVTVTLSAPLQTNAEIRYTLDGAAPTPASLLYGGPFTITNSTRVRAQAFANGRPAGRESEGAFDRLGPTPPLPDIFLGDLKPTLTTGFGHTYSGTVRYSGQARSPQKDRSNTGGELRLNRRTYPQGLGVHAPCAVQYALQPGFKRFVALAGVDEQVVATSNGSNLAMHPSIVFKVFIDGAEAATSPIMRVQFPAWRFDVPIPAHARSIRLVATDAGDGSREDLADWAMAGFITR